MQNELISSSTILFISVCFVSDIVQEDPDSESNNQGQN